MSEAKQETRQEFGPDGQGNYITPYKFTVIFNPDSVFETAVAYLCDQAQLIPFIKGDDYSMVAKNCEHPSPEVLIFDHGFSQEDISKFFDRGFELVHIFSSAPIAKYNLENSDEPFDVRVAVFGLLEIYEHALLLPGIMPMLMLEYILCAEFHHYESLLRNKDVNHVNGKLLCEMLSLDKRPLGEVILRTASTYKCEDIIRSFVAQGRAIHEERERLSLVLLNTGVRYNYDSHVVYAVNGGPLTATMTKIMPAHPRLQGCDFVLFYNIECYDLENNTYPGWRLTLIALKSNVSAHETLRLLSEQNMISGDINVATTWLPALSCMKILPFIYPDYEDDNLSNVTNSSEEDDKMLSHEDSEKEVVEQDEPSDDKKLPRDYFNICGCGNYDIEDENWVVHNREAVEAMDISD